MIVLVVLLAIPGALIVVSFLGVLLFGTTGGSSESGAVEVGEATATDIPTTENPLIVGTPFTVDDFEYTVTGLECGIPSVGGEVVKEEATGHFCALGLTAKNVANAAADLDYDDFTLVEGDIRYSTDSWVNIRGNGEGESAGFLDEINPGLTVTGRIFFDVPTDVTPSRAVLSDSWFAEDVYVELGQ